jgi:transposase
VNTMADEIVDVIGGVDTHGDVHVAAVVDSTGRILGTASFPTTPAGYRRLLSWMRKHGVVIRVGVEGTGSWGAGLARYLSGEAVEVVEVDRPNRQLRRLRGKSDPVDAEAAARAALNGEAKGTPKARTGPVEAIRALRVARRSAMKARTQALAQIRALITTGPEELRAQLRPLTTADVVTLAARYRPGDATTVVGATKLALRELAQRVRYLEDQVDRLDATLAPLVTATCPALVARVGVGPQTAAALLVAAGDNPDRLRDEAAFAALCGTSPVEASSGRVIRHRLNRGGDRQANHALWRIVFVRMRFDPRTRDYVERRTKEGLSRKEIMRCLKRFVAREVYQCIVNGQSASAAPTNADNDRTARPHGRHRRPRAIIGACGAP